MTGAARAVGDAAEVQVRGHNPGAVIEAVRDRLARWRAGDRRPDARKLGLVLEGGGMRAAVSAGGAWVLAEHGYASVFDEVYATSAGVMNASYMISGQHDLGIGIWFDECASRAFINFARFWKVLDVDYIFDEVVARRKPLDVKRVVQARCRFSVPLIDRATGEAFMVDTKATATPLLDVLKAATAIPVFYNRTVEVDGRHCLDGGMGIPFPIHQALQDGCTDVLVFSTRPDGYASRAPSGPARFLFDLTFARGNEGLRRAFREYHLRSREARKLASARSPLPGAANVATLCTEGVENVGRLTRDADRLHRAATSYARRTMELFGHETGGLRIPR